MADLGQEIIGNILEGLKIADSRKARQGELAEAQKRTQIESERAQAERQFREAQVQQQKDSLAEQKRQFDLNLKAAQALHNAQINEKLQSIGTTYAQTGVAPPDTQVVPSATSAQGGSYTPTNPQQATQQTLVMPGGQQISVPTPQAYAQRQADLKRAMLAPEVEARLKEQSSEHGFRLEEQKQQQAAAKELADLNKSWQLEIAKMQRDSAEGVARMHDATQRFVATLPYRWFQDSGLSVGQTSDILKPYVEGVYTGTISPKDLKADFAAKGLGGADAAVMSAVMKAGGVPLNDKQVATVNSLSIFPEIVKGIDTLIDSLPKTEGMKAGSSVNAGMKGLMTFGDKNISVAQQSLESQIGRVALIVGGDQGQRLQKALLTSSEGGYMPSRFEPTDANIKRRNNFVSIVNSILKDSALRGIPETQQNAILTKAGLANLAPRPYMSTQAQPATSSHFVYQRDPKTGKLVQVPVQ